MADRIKNSVRFFFVIFFFAGGGGIGKRNVTFLGD